MMMNEFSVFDIIFFMGYVGRGMDWWSAFFYEELELMVKGVYSVSFWPVEISLVLVWERLKKCFN